MSASEPYPLTPADAVCAIVVTPDRRFLLQHRDDIPQIWYPGAWALFGGAIEPGETELEALRRELKEEIDYDVAEATLFCRFDFELSFMGARPIFRSFYEVPIALEAIPGLRLQEGRGMQLWTAEEVLQLPHITGYDNFGLYMYIHRARLRPPSA